VRIRKASEPVGPPSQDARPLAVFRNFLLSVFLVPLSQVRSRHLSLYIEHLNYLLWVRSTFEVSRYHYSREDLWRSVARTIQNSKAESWSEYELGVAFDYTTWWFMNEDLPQIFRWRGFDSFTGLPTEWRNLQAGAFSNDGETPTIDDNRVTYVRGDVRDTFATETFDESPKLVFFDLDLYKPTLRSWELLEEHLGPGDIMVFDEAFDTGERVVVENYVMRRFQVEPIGHTHSQLALRIRARHYREVV